MNNTVRDIMKLADAYADAAYEANFDDSMTKARAALEAAVTQQAEEIAALQAKLSAMEKQEPVAWMYWDANAGSRGFYKVDPLLPHTEGAFPVYAAPKVAPVEAVEPIWWWYRTNGKYDHFQDRRPDHDAYDEGSLKPLFTSHKLPGPEVQQVIPVDGWKVRIRGTQTYLHVTGIYDDTVYVDLPAAPKALKPLTREDVVGHANSVGFRSAGSCCSVPLKFCSTDMWVGNLLSFVRAIEAAHNIGGQQP